MKREGFHHRKVRGLSRLFERAGRENPEMQARAALEGLWFVTATHAPHGNVGARCTDEEIADLIGWRRDPHELIAALLEQRWLDASEVHRLLVHDWSHHADKHVHRAVIRSLLHFADGRRPRVSEGTERERIAWMRFHVPECGVCSGRVKRTLIAGDPAGDPGGIPAGSSLSLSLSGNRHRDPGGDPGGDPADDALDLPMGREEASRKLLELEARLRRRGRA